MRYRLRVKGIYGHTKLNIVLCVCVCVCECVFAYIDSIYVCLCGYTTHQT